MKQIHVFDRLLQRCEEAFAARVPILYILTDEIEVIDRLIASDRLVVRLVKEEDRATQQYGYRPAFGVSDKRAIINLRFGLPTVSTVGSRDQKAVFPILYAAHMTAMPKDNGLTKYVEDYVADSDDNGILRSSALILYGSTIYLPDELLPYADFIELDYPESWEIKEIVRQEMADYRVGEFEDERELDDIALSLTGFTCTQARKLVCRILSGNDVDGCNPIFRHAAVTATIRRTKEQLLLRGDVLELINTDVSAEIGGMEQFKDWLEEQKKSLLNAAVNAKTLGVGAPKGVLICGIPGCGKSMAATMLGQQFHIPLLKMDVGNLMGRYVGDSEHNMIEALRLTEAMSPCILWIDELDKGFSSAGNEGGSNEVFKRMFGTLLTWMQENRKPCFIFATANSLSGMPKEFFRSGRFDELFSLYMPTFDECIDIFRKRMDAYARRVSREDGTALFMDACFSRETLEKAMEAFVSEETPSENRFVTGADIDKIVRLAILKIAETDASPTIRPDQWINAVRRVLSQIRVYGDSSENMDSIAVCYIRLMRNNFIPACRTALFSPEDYCVRYETDGAKVELRKRSKEELEKMHDYDGWMFEVLAERIERLAPTLEEIERRRLIV